MDYFKSQKARDGTTYSIDMVRLKLDFGKKAQDFTDYMSHISTFDLRFEVEYSYSFSQFKYRHLWTVRDTLQDTASWTVGLGINKQQSVGFIEFNPNKVESSPLWRGFWQTIKDRTCIRDLVRYDLAIDIPRPRNEVYLIRQGKQTYQLVVSDGGRTEYIGQRSHNGFVKLYDKTKEANLDVDLTRLEITLDEKTDIRSVFPDVRYIGQQTELLVGCDELTRSNKALLELVLNSGSPQYYLHKLSYHMRKKIEPYLGDKALSIDTKAFNRSRELALSYES